MVAGEGTVFEVENPSDESVVTTIQGLSLAQVQAAIASARHTFDKSDWSLLPRADRTAKVRRFAAELEARSERFRELAVLEAGCPVSSGVMGAQVATPSAMPSIAATCICSCPKSRKTRCRCTNASA